MILMLILTFAFGLGSALAFVREDRLNRRSRRDVLKDLFLVVCAAAVGVYIMSKGQLVNNAGVWLAFVGVAALSYVPALYVIRPQDQYGRSY